MDHWGYARVLWLCTYHVPQHISCASTHIMCLNTYHVPGHVSCAWTRIMCLDTKPVSQSTHVSIRIMCLDTDHGPLGKSTQCVDTTPVPNRPMGRYVSCVYRRSLWRNRPNVSTRRLCPTLDHLGLDTYHVPKHG